MESGIGNCSSEDVRTSSVVSSSNANSSSQNYPSSARQNVKALASGVVGIGTPTTLPTASLLHRNSSLPVPTKILSKNYNNTVFPTSYPNNMAELQLFRVMQNASLLYYYDTLLEMGGDDVQQLCDAGEEEFLEIMSLVGMASKPLHVRRFQKSLQEWVTNSGKFKARLVLGEDYELEASSPRLIGGHDIYSTETTEIGRPLYSPSSGEICALPPVPSPGLSVSSKRPYSPLDSSTPCLLSSSSSPVNNMSMQLTPTLLDSQIVKLAKAAERLSKQLPQFEPKSSGTKKKMSKELESVMSMSENDPRRMDEIRRYAAIYGRFDCKRRPEKPLTLHEVSVNEAAAQICRFVPALLTRRDELFPLARQVVKDSGCHYSKTHIPTSFSQGLASYERENLSEASSCTSRSASRLSSSESQDVSSSKRLKLESNEAEADDQQGLSRQDSNANNIITRSPIHSLFQINSKQQLISNSKETSRQTSSSTMADYDETESQFSYTNSSPAYQGSQEDTENCYSTENNQKSGEDYSDSGPEDGYKYSPKIVAASGDNIIAVANPALVMSPTMLVVDNKDKKKLNC